MTEYPRYEIRWWDANSDARWQDISELHELALVEVRSLGYLMLKDEIKIILAQSINYEAEQMDSPLVIPADSVINMEQL